VPAETDKSRELCELAQRIADALPPEVAQEVIVTGSVSRGAADDFSDIELLVVTPEVLPLETCFEYARAAELTSLGTWGPQETPARRVSGMREGVPLELIWWSREFAESQMSALLAGQVTSSADAIFHGVALRTGGLLAQWQERLRTYPDDLAAAQIEDAALPWGGFAAEGLLTLTRPGERLALVEWMLDGAVRVVRIVFALNRVWVPTTKRLAMRVEPLGVKPARMAERVDDALTEPDPLKALLMMTELQLDAVELAPSGPNIDRARMWLTDGVEILRKSPR
jgi:predicted nucleotidyltransferase